MSRGQIIAIQFALVNVTGALVFAPWLTGYRTVLLLLAEGALIVAMAVNLVKWIKEMWAS